MLYLRWIQVATVLTGVAGLVFQIAWQRYLTLLLGVESRSVSLVIAVFLLGLAAGYRHWGRATERGRERAALLRLYGLIEIAIGLWALVFPFTFRVVRGLADALPALGFAGDVLWSCVLLLPPTFLMGATVPLLTAALPARLSEVNRCHARVYGLNTLGACAGALLAGFVLIPELGLIGALHAGAGLDLIVGATLVANRLPGGVLPGRAIPKLPTRLAPREVIALTFTSGAVVVAAEVLVVRLVGLSVGAGTHVYPIVVSVFIFGLALGALSLSRRRSRPASVRVTLAAAALGYAFVHWSAPYWPYWLSNVRVTLATLPTSYPVWLALVLAFVALVTLPFLLAAGRLLPVCYALLDKDAADYGRRCGQLYAWNTLGTVLGAVGLGHLSLHVLSLEHASLAALLLLLGALVLVLVREQRLVPAAAALAAVVAALLQPAWNRSSHQHGLFRLREAQDYHFEGPLAIPENRPELLFFADDPNVTVSIARDPGGEGAGTAVMVNGKPEGNTRSGDFGTMVMSGSLGYFYAPDRADLRAAVVGFGTGLSAGVLARAEQIASVTILELSEAVLEGAPLFAQDNFDVLASPKVHVVQEDAFRWFARGAEPVDVVVSEPSNPWVAGIENFYTRGFYERVQHALTPGGVLVQWLQLYEIDTPCVQAMLENLLAVFPHARLYLVGLRDAAVVTSATPLAGPALARRFAEPAMAEIHARLSLGSLDALEVLHLYDTRELRALATGGPLSGHDQERPRLGAAATRAHFLGTGIEHDALLGPDAARLLRYRPELAEAVRVLAERHPTGLPGCDADSMYTAVCPRFADLLGAVASLRQSGGERLGAYHHLRELGALAADPALLAAERDRLLAQPAPASAEDRKAAIFYFQELAREGEWDTARSELEDFVKRGLLKKETAVQVGAGIAATRAVQATMLERAGSD